MRSLSWKVLKRWIWGLTGSSQEIFFSTSQPLCSWVFYSRSCCFNAWCWIAFSLALKGVFTMTGKKLDFEALQPPASASSWHSKNSLCHAFSSSSSHCNALHCNTLHCNALERRGRRLLLNHSRIAISTTNVCYGVPDRTSEGRSCAHAQSV